MYLSKLTTFLALSMMLMGLINASTGSLEEKLEKDWQAQKDFLLDIDDVRSDAIENVTDIFLTVTAKLVRAGRLMIQIKRRMVILIDAIGELSYDAQWALLGWFGAMIFFPLFTGAVVATIISVCFQNELINLQTLLHTRWDVGDKPDIITESKMKRRLGNLAMQRLFQQYSRRPEKMLPIQGKRDPEALIRIKQELPEPKEVSNLG
ncbi:unnamed protein product [Thelazia callipaeda]|uniref:CNNM transmembrane domain-containing protein n=1 Tax=Thelazia callipaeda TaxID=103827 RepID=A0A0N5CMT0_THECL|nr:unnamed protein product [Thelazia callipaeda]